jgi:hypothetical protein
MRNGREVTVDGRAAESEGGRTLFVVGFPIECMMRLEVRLPA